jgi:D-serine deaminase-like pyridoxal phosphate-dependent protein
MVAAVNEKINAMELPLSTYAVAEAEQLITPALLIYPKLVDTNIRATLALVGDDPERWRPHIKTAKLGATTRRLISHGIRNFKCSTTLELLSACQVEAADVLVAFAMTGANARRVVQLSREYPKTRISALVESSTQAAQWRGTGLGVFIDVNSGMNRTGMSQERAAEIVALAAEIGVNFRGLHWYDGHMTAADPLERKTRAFAGYDHLMEVARALEAAGIPVGEVITSGTPAAPAGISYPGFTAASFIHRISPGTVIYNDTSSLQQLAGFGYQAAAAVLTTVISHPLSQQITCDAGHKSVSVDSGVPNCVVAGHPEFKPLKPSEEHLPIEIPAGTRVPAIGEKLYLIPRHVCPTVNNFDQAVMIVDGRITGVESVTARGHENPSLLALANK